MFKRKTRQRFVNADQQLAKPVYSYYSGTAQSGNSASRLSEIKRASATSFKWWQHAPSILAVFVIVGSVFYSLGLNSNPIIVQASNNGNLFLQDTNTYRQAAHTFFNHSILNKNKITVNVSGITTQLKQQFPELAGVTITIPVISHRPMVYIVPSQPSLILRAKNGTYILNNTGLAVLPIARAKNISSLKLPTVDDRSNVAVVQGKTALPKDNVHFITTAYAQLQAQKLSVSNLTLPPLASEIDLRLKGQKYYIKMDMLGDAKEQVGAVIATQQYLKKINQTPTAYIDVRVEGRVYIK